MNLTERTRHYLKETLPLEDLLPTRMPVYVNSVAYLFGVSTLSALAVVIGSGLVLAIFGPAWYHRSGIGHFFNSLHFWGVQLFFGALLLHLASKYTMAAWRDGRWHTGSWGY